MRLSAGALTAAVLVLVAGCAPSRVVVRGASNTAAVDLARCAKRQLERLGYTIRDGDPEERVIRGTRNTASTMAVLRSGKDAEDLLVVSTETVGPDGGGSMSVAGESLFWRGNGRKLNERPSRDVLLQARRIFEACGILDAAQVAAP